MKLLMENWRKFVNEEVNTEEEAAQWLATQIAPLIDAADAGNYTEPLAQLVARLNSPDGVSPMVRDLLSSGDEDVGGAEDEAVRTTTTEIPAPQLIPTQGVIDLFKSVGYNGSVAESLRSVIGGVSGAPPILAAGKGGQYYIIDGHHRWSGATVFNVNCKIPANIIIMDPGKALLVSQLAIAAYLGAGKKLPSATAKKGRSIIGPDAMSSDAVYKLLKQNIGKVIDPAARAPFWNPEVQQVVIETGYGKSQLSSAGEEPEELQEFNQMQVAMASEGGLKEIASNCGKLAAKYKSDGPPREIMPQFDPDKGGPKFKTVEPDLKVGKLNYKPEFRRVVKKAAE